MRNVSRLAFWDFEEMHSASRVMVGHDLSITISTKENGGSILNIAVDIAVSITTWVVQSGVERATFCQKTVFLGFPYPFIFPTLVYHPYFSCIICLVFHQCILSGIWETSRPVASIGLIIGIRTRLKSKLKR